MQLRRSGLIRLAVGVALTFTAATMLAAQSRRAPMLEIEVAQIGRTGPLCLHHEGVALAAGTVVWLVQPDTPQSVARAVPGTGVCGAWPDLAEKALVPLRPIAGALDGTRLSIAVVAPARKPVARGGRVEADLDGDGVPERFRACTSSEGVHLTIWSGQPLTGRLRWHRYVYLGYDVDPTCAAAETGEPVPGAALGRPAAAAGQ